MIYSVDLCYYYINKRNVSIYVDFIGALSAHQNGAMVNSGMTGGSKTKRHEGDDRRHIDDAA